MSRPAPLLRATLAQTAVELRLTARRGENLLAMLGIPAAVLLVFGSGAVPGPQATGSRIDALLPGVLALAIIATSLVNLGIATAYERSYGVLKRLGGSPLGRTGLVGAKILAVLVIELGLLVLLTALAAGFLGWRPPAAGPSWPLLIGAIALGTATFAGLGLGLAGALRAEATLLLANVLFLLVLGIGGVLIPVADLPGPVAPVVALLPPAALVDLLGDGLAGSAVETRAILTLALWAAGSVTLAIRTFRFD
ncbi:MAG: ABC transporter permease [Candidatus Limnocylindrales bacterium]